MKKTQRGITLIALIITIVVLLILAVVAIGAAQESNIVGYAQNAATKYEEGKGIENNTISDMEELLGMYANGVIPEGNDIGSGSNPSVTPTPTPNEWAAYGTQNEYYLVGDSKAYLVKNENLEQEYIFKQDKPLKEYYAGGYNFDSSIKDISKVLVVILENIEYPGAAIISDTVNTFVGHNNTKVMSINKTYNKNNQIDYSSILEQIANN